jgi:CheY-like chemotaxis protein
LNYWSYEPSRLETFFSKRGSLPICNSKLRQASVSHLVMTTSPSSTTASSIEQGFPLSPSASEASAAPSEVVAGSNGSPLRLLLVEDHVDTARAMFFLLGREGYDVTVAHCAAEALKLFDLHHFDLIVSDIGLPDGCGYDLMRQLHAKHPHPLKAVALSGYGGDEDRARSRAAGFARHVTKPVNLTALTAVLKEVAAAELPGELLLPS